MGVVSVATRLLGEVWSYSSLCGKDHHRSVEVKIHTSTSGVLQDQATFCKSVMLTGDVYTLLFSVQEVAGLGGNVQFCKMELQTEVFQKIFSEFVSHSAFK